MKRKFIFYLSFLIIAYTPTFSQEYKDYISPQCDAYYNSNPSGIREHFEAKEFITVIDFVDFVPQSSLINKDVKMLKKVLLMLEFDALRQMMINGDFYSRSKKHDDYFELYDMGYKKISKQDWDNHRPYLIPLMEIDKVIILN